MSATYVITVLRQLDEHRALWRVRPTTATSPDDRAYTRSFALTAAGLQTGALEVDDLLSEAFHRSSVADHVRTVSLAGAFHVTRQWPPFVDELLEEVSALEPRAREDRLAETLPHFLLFVDFVDPSLPAALPEVFGTTAYDVWYDDPERRNDHGLRSQGELRRWLRAAYAPGTSTRPGGFVVCAAAGPRLVGIDRHSKQPGYLELGEPTPRLVSLLPRMADLAFITATSQSVVLATRRKVFICTGDDGVQTVDAKSGLPKGDVVGLSVLDGAAWVATRKGLAQLGPVGVTDTRALPKKMKTPIGYGTSEGAHWFAGDRLLRIKGDDEDVVELPGKVFASRILPVDDENALISTEPGQPSWHWTVGSDPVVFSEEEIVAVVDHGGTRTVVFADGAVADWGSAGLGEPRLVTESPTRVCGALVHEGELVLYGTALTRVNGLAAR